MKKSDIKKVDKIDEISTVEITPTEVAKPASSLKRWIIGLIVLAVAIALIYFYCWPYFMSRISAPSNNNQGQMSQAEIMATVARVKKLMILPENEVPQIAEIRDAALAAKDQPFYLGSQNGDKVLVYLSSRKAIIYSPSRNLIVNVGPIYMDESAASTKTNNTPVATTTTKKK